VCRHLCLSAHMCGEGGGLDSLYILSTTFTNKQIDEKVPGEHLAGVKLKKYFCACITSVRRMKHLNFFFLWTHLVVQGVGKDPKGSSRRWNLGPLLDHFRRNPYEARNLQKNNIFRQQFHLLPLSLFHRYIWSLFPGQKPEKCYLVIVWVELKSCLLGARVFVLTATCFLKKNCMNRKL